MLRQIRCLSNNFSKAREKGKKALQVRIKCDHKFDTKGSKKHKHSCFKSNALLQKTGYPRHSKSC